MKLAAVSEINTTANFMIEPVGHPPAAPSLPPP